MASTSLTAEQTAMYLERIGLPSRKEPSASYLAELMWAHLTHVPFESLTPFLCGRAPSLDVRDLFDKIVVRHRGGYCFELNGLFRALLDALGFRCFCVGVCILRRGMRRDHVIVHRGVIVDTDEGRYYADVGYGGPCPVTPVLMDRASGWQQSGSRKYRYDERDGYCFIDMQDRGEEFPLFRFLIDPLEDSDFDGPNRLAASGPHFGGDYVVSMLYDDGHASLDGHLFKRVKTGETCEKALSDADIPSYLKEYFGIEL